MLTGPTGAGKTWLACAFGHQAIRQGMTVCYRRLPKLRATLVKAKVLVLDDWGVVKLTARQREDLLEVVDDRIGTSSLIVTAQIPISQWHDYLGDPTLADAILDRIVHNAHRIELKGESMRKPTGDTWAQQRLRTGLMPLPQSSLSSSRHLASHSEQVEPMHCVN